MVISQYLNHEFRSIYNYLSYLRRGSHQHDCMVIGFTFTYEISAYHH
jgi:hypothetical protein